MLDRLLFSLGPHPILVLIFGALFVWWAISRISEELAIRKLGGHAAQVRSWVPFGIKFVIDNVRHGQTDDMLNFWHSGFVKYGKPANPYTLEVRIGGRRIIATADPENIKAILAAQFNDYGKGSVFNEDFKDFLGDGIFSTDGQTWHDSRQLIRPQFVKDRVSDLQCFERHSSILISALGGQGQPVDVKDLFFRFTLDAATDFLLGHSADSLHNPQSQFAHSFAQIQKIQSVIMRVGPFKVFLSRKELRQHVAILNAFVEPYIDAALALTPDELEKRTKTDEGYTFLHAVAAYTRDRKVLRDQLVAVLLAGRDTTACTLSWLLWEISQQPQLVADLRREIHDRIGFDKAPSYDDLKSMKTLQNTMNETLRLYPVVPFNIRFALKDTTLPKGGGPDGSQPFGLPKGTAVGYSTHYMQLTPEIYPEISDRFPPPDVFAPKRWDHWSPKHWSYIPFNGGPRICVGQNFALMEMGYTITRILQRFSRVEARMSGLSGSDGMAGLNEKGKMEDRGLRGGFEGVGGAQSEEKWNQRPWSRRSVTNEPDLIEKSMRKRDRMVSEIVLQPGREVRVAFYE